MKSEIAHCTYHGRFMIPTGITEVRSDVAIKGTGRDCDSTSQSTVLEKQEVRSYLRRWLREPRTCQGDTSNRSVQSLY
jgi:hypothetical protein